MCDQLVDKIKEELSDPSYTENMIKVEIPESVFIKVEEQGLSDLETSIKSEVLDYEEISTKIESYGAIPSVCSAKFESSLDLKIDCKENDLKVFNEDIQEIKKLFKLKEILTCYYCNFKGVRRTLIKHISVHNKNQDIAIERKLGKHIKKRLIKECNKDSYKCNFCCYKAPDYSVLKAHMNSHNGEKNFKCEYCNYDAKYKSSLKIHLMRHSNETPFACPYCDYKAVKNSDLNRHIIIHTGEKPFKCENCNYKTNRSYRLKVHIMRLHSFERPYKCSVCDYKATTGSDFKRHMCIHKEKKPYSCNQCNYVTSRLYDLKMHLNKHSGKFLHQCDLCGHKTNYLSSFKKHMKIHSKRKFK